MKVVIYGVGKMAEFIYYSFQNDSCYEVIAFCADETYLDPEKPTLFGCPVLSFTEITQMFPPGHYLLHIAIGRNNAREIIFNKAKELGYEFANYICSKANVWPDLVIGQNVFIDQASVIQPYVTIGDNCMFIGARIGHHSRIENNSLLSGCSLAGSVTIGANSFLGLNSSIKEGVQIGVQNIIGAGCFISKNTENGSMIYQDRSVQKVVTSRNIVLFNTPGANQTNLNSVNV
jgi:sugar O-acyltransferase (sialic acid O-acetyltransferase NeuD family)